VSDPWSRPPQQPNPSGPAAEPPTQQIPQRGQYPDAATQKFPEPQPPTQAGPLPGATSYPPPAHVPPAAPGGGGEGPPPAKGPFLKRLFRDPLSIVLVVVIVLALAAAGLVGAEIYARHRGNEVVGKATACVVQDGATASFGGVTPFLLQHLTKHYSSISIETAGNNIRDAKGMKAQIEIDDVQLQQSGNSNGTIGSLDATITWSADGIKQTIQNAIPLVGSFVTGAKANKSDGTIELQMALGEIVVKPKVDNGGIGLDVEQLTGLGFTLPRETVQPALDAFAGQLTKNYPMNIKADSVEVTDDGVISKFSTKNATIPTGGQDPCFADL
jgi:hypothetical protein